MTTDLVNNSNIRPVMMSPQNPTYYRSRVFTAESGLNELVIAAQPLLVLITRIMQDNADPDLQQFSEHLVHELKTYESRAEQFRYDRKTLQLGRYFLVMAIEEASRSQSWYVSWKALDPLAGYLEEGQLQEQVPAVLERLYQQPQSHLDVLELSYLCLSLSDTHGQWHSLLDPLYQRIRALRGEINQKFFFNRPHYLPIVRSRGFPLWGTAAACGIVLCGFFALYTYLIGSV